MTDSLQKLSAVAESNGAALKSMVEIALETSEAMFELNLSLARELSATGRESLVGSLLGPDAGEARARPHQFELGADYVRNLNEIFSRAQSGIAQVHLDQMNELSRSLNTLARDFTSGGPVGSAETLDQFRLAMVQVSEAYEHLFQSARNVMAGAVASTARDTLPTQGNTRARKARGTV
ncbi:MAG TPA: hypothetical protein PLR02_13495 [Rhodocyclaceae bacterium]|nr:hypothetical protein [Rhodocyclaceae bacterium]